MKLVKNNSYLLLIDEEAEIKEGKTFITKDNIIHSNYGYNYGDRVVVAYYPLIDEAKELDLPLLPNPFEEVDIEEEFNRVDDEKIRYSTEESLEWSAYKIGFFDGYKAAQSKQFSLEDMKDILEEGLNWFGNGRDKEIKDSETWFNHYIKLLSTQRLPKEFIPEYDLMNEGYNKPEDYPYQECKVLKTTINSENKQELVGTYKYENSKDN